MINPTNFVRETIDLIKQIETRFLELGSRLYKIREEKLWQDGYDSYEEFLDSAHMTPGNASILAKVHEYYVLKGGMSNEQLAGIGYSTLYEAIPLLKSESIESVVNKAKVLTRNEIKQEVRDETHSDCEHKETFTICSKCHKRI